MDIDNYTDNTDIIFVKAWNFKFINNRFRLNFNKWTAVTDIVEI